MENRWIRFGLLVLGIALLLAGARCCFLPVGREVPGPPAVPPEAAIRGIRTAGEGDPSAEPTPPLRPAEPAPTPVSGEQSPPPREIAILTELLPDGVAGESYRHPLESSGIEGPAVWALAGGELPPGLGLSAEGVISGVPEGPGEGRFTVRLEAGDGRSARKDLRLLIREAHKENGGPRIVNETLPDALLGRYYLYQLEAEGGLPPYLWRVETGEPPEAIRLDPAGGALIGIPRQTGSFPFTVVVADEADNAASREFQLRVGEGGLEIVTDALPPAVRGENYHLALRARGGAVPYLWEQAAGRLPGGLSLDRERGIISGRPPDLESSSFLVRVSDREGRTAEKEFELLVTGEYDPTVGDDGLRILTLALPDGVRGELYRLRLEAAGGEPPYLWTVSENDLPPGLWLEAETGEIAGIPELAGESAFTVMVTDGRRRAARRRFSLVIAPQLVYITTGNLEPAYVEEDYQVRIEAIGGTPPYLFSLDGGALPAGLSLSADGRISGLVSGEYRGRCPEEFVFRVRAEDSAENCDIAEFRLSVLESVEELEILTGSLPRGSVAAEYRAVLEAAGGTEPYSWSFSGLPGGLSGTRDGVISGEPRRAETSPVEVEVTDSGDRTARKEFNLTVGEVFGVERVISAPGDAKAGLAWRNPGGDEFAGVKVLRKTGSYPANPADGEVVYSGTADNIVDDGGLINGVTYFYAVVAYDCDDHPAKIDDNALTSVTPRAVSVSGPHHPCADRVEGFYPLSDHGFGPTWAIGDSLEGDHYEIRDRVVAIRQGGSAAPPGVYILLDSGAKGQVGDSPCGGLGTGEGYCAEGLGGRIDGTFSPYSRFNGRPVYRNPDGWYLFWISYFEEDTFRTSRALGLPTGRGIYQGSTEVISLQAKAYDGAPPCGGTIILKFADNIVVNGPGPDFTVFENVFFINGDESRRFIEPAVVAVSQDGSTWREFPYDYRPSYTADGNINFYNPYSYNYGFAGIEPVFSNRGYPDPTDPAVSGGDFFDLDDLPGRPFSWIRYVRITSTGDLWLRGESGNLVRHTPETGSLSGVGSSGFDLDAVCAINY